MNWYDILKSNKKWDTFGPRIYKIAKKEDKLGVVARFLSAMLGNRVNTQKEWEWWVNKIGPSQTLIYLGMYRVIFKSASLRHMFIPEEIKDLNFLLLTGHQFNPDNYPRLNKSIQLVESKKLNNIFIVERLDEKAWAHGKIRTSRSCYYYTNGFIFQIKHPYFYDRSKNATQFKAFFNKLIKGKSYLLIHQFDPSSTPPKKTKYKVIRGGFI